MDICWTLRRRGEGRGILLYNTKFSRDLNFANGQPKAFREHLIFANSGVPGLHFCPKMAKKLMKEEINSQSKKTRSHDAEWSRTLRLRREHRQKTSPGLVVQASKQHVWPNNAEYMYIVSQGPKDFKATHRPNNAGSHPFPTSFKATLWPNVHVTFLLLQ